MDHLRPVQLKRVYEEHNGTSETTWTSSPEEKTSNSNKREENDSSTYSMRKADVTSSFWSKKEKKKKRYFRNRILLPKDLSYHFRYVLGRQEWPFLNGSVLGGMGRMRDVESWVDSYRSRHPAAS